MAEAIFRAEIKRRKIKFVDAASAGLFAENSECISEKSAVCLKERGIDFSKFHPRQLKHKMMESSYPVVCMTRAQSELLEGAFENVYSMGDIAGFDIPDPYGQDIEAYRKTARLIEIAVNKIIERFFAGDETPKNIKNSEL